MRHKRQESDVLPDSKSSKALLPETQTNYTLKTTCCCQRPSTQNIRQPTPKQQSSGNAIHFTINDPQSVLSVSHTYKLSTQCLSSKVTAD